MEVQNYSRHNELQFTQLNQRVKALMAKWNIKKHQCAMAQMDKTQEELNELRDEILLYCTSGFGDNLLDTDTRLRGELGDVLFCVLGVAAQLDVDPLEVLQETCTKNEGRKGKTIKGTFVKEQDL